MLAQHSAQNIVVKGITNVNAISFLKELKQFCINASMMCNYMIVRS